MTRFFTAKYSAIESGFMGQIVEWPEVVTEGSTLEECRESLVDALHEMSLAQGDLGREVPFVHALFEQIPVEV
jgi:predicted RNase H-like HicB family nuclease